MVTLLTSEGHVSEGSAENVFIVRDGTLITPPVTADILEGITRDTVIRMAEEQLGLQVVERHIGRTELYVADEAFFVGTGAQVSPICEIDHRPVGDGAIGPISKMIQQMYFDVVRGRVATYRGWCQPVFAGGEERKTLELSERFKPEENEPVYLSLTPRMIGVSVDYEEAAELAGANGFKGLFVDIPFLMTVGPDALKNVLDRHGLKPGVFSLPVSFRESETVYRESIRDLAEIAEAARKVGCARCSTYVFSWSDELDFEANYEFHRKRLTEPAKILADHGIALGLEFLGPKTLRDRRPYSFIHTLEDMLDLGEAIGTGNVGLLLDAWHWYTSGSTIDAIKNLTPNQVVDVHINDAPKGIPIDKQIDAIRCLPGDTGVIDLTGFLTSLAHIGYNGPVTVEPFNEEVRKLSSQEAVYRTAEAAKNVWRDAGLD